MPNKPVSRGTFVRSLFTTVGTALASGFAGVTAFGASSKSSTSTKQVVAVREPRTVARREAA